MKKTKRQPERLRVFISSVQKEFEIERVAIAGVVSGDRFLSVECDPRPLTSKYSRPQKARQMVISLCLKNGKTNLRVNKSANLIIRLNLIMHINFRYEVLMSVYE